MQLAYIQCCDLVLDNVRATLFLAYIQMSHWSGLLSGKTQATPFSQYSLMSAILLKIKLVTDY